MTTQIYKHRQYSRTVVKNNILRIWNITTPEERLDWYSDARRFAVELTVEYNSQYSCKTGKLEQIKLSQVIGVIAAFSPRKHWEINKRMARELIFSGIARHMSTFNDKARRIMTSDGTDESVLAILNGRKISAFYMNIKYPEQANFITIDRHALSIALGYYTNESDYAGMTATQYDFFVQCYTIAAMKVKTTPLIMQSATWTRWRKIKHESKYKRNEH